MIETCLHLIVTCKKHLHFKKEKNYIEKRTTVNVSMARNGFLINWFLLLLYSEAVQ